MMEINSDHKIINKKISGLFSTFDTYDSPGYAIGVMHQNNLIFNQGFGQATLEHPSPINSKTVFDIGSMAKQFVGMSIALLEENEQLSIEDTIHKYLPEFPDYGHKITLSDLLYHCSGIRNYSVMAYYMIGIHESDAISNEEIYDLLLRIKSLNFKPGSKYEYSDSNYFLLGKIIEHITGQSLNTFAAESIFKPLGMKNSLFREVHSQIIPRRAMSYVKHPIAFKSPVQYSKSRRDQNTFHTLVSNYEHIGAEGIFTSLEDLFKWTHNFSSNQLGKRKQSLIKNMLSPGIQINDSLAYGYGINTGTFEDMKYFGHNGAIHGYTSSLAVFPEEDLSIICLSNHNQTGAWEFRKPILEILYPQKSVSIPNAKLEQPEEYEKHAKFSHISGKYQNPETASMWDVFIKDDHCFVRENFGREFELFAKSSSEYQALPSYLNTRVVFETNNAGKVTELKAIIEGKTSTFIPFLKDSYSIHELEDYEGEYFSDELQTTFMVIPDSQGIQLKNKNRHFCSMDLLYTPTIKDYFMAFDPHPYCSQISFLRVEEEIFALVYRDYDGDGRENILFHKLIPKLEQSSQ
ncbi:MAG: beta-lactamase family protein [Anaerolineaceae bacterium]|nr:beta-lactamase family protein [Anaerolineaceae bacterium]